MRRQAHARCGGRLQGLPARPRRCCLQKGVPAQHDLQQGLCASGALGRKRGLAQGEKRGRERRGEHRGSVLTPAWPAQVVTKKGGHLNFPRLITASTKD